MPNYGTLPLTGTGSGILATVLMPGDQVKLFDAESPAAPQASIAIARGSAALGAVPTTFQIFFAAAPTDSLLIEGSMSDTPAGWAGAVALKTSTNTQADSYTDTGAWMFYRARLVTQSGGGAVTVIAAR